MPVKHKNLKKVVGELKNASKMHLKQSEIIGKHITDMGPLNKSPMLRKLSAGCKAAAKRKFKVYPSAYANMWASKQQGKGKC